jgi:AcrR family transcriptional regulator
MVTSMVPPGRRRLDRASRRTLIVDAAVVVFCGRNAADVTFDEVADGAGVSRALVYNYFGDRQGLLAAVHQRVFDELQLEVTEELGTALDFEHAVMALVRAHVRYAMRDADRYRLVRDALRSSAEDRLANATEGLGGTPAARLVVQGEAAALGAMVSAWASTRLLSEDDAVAVIAATLWSGLSDLDRLGITVLPFWARATTT